MSMIPAGVAALLTAVVGPLLAGTLLHQGHLECSRSSSRPRFRRAYLIAYTRAFTDHDAPPPDAD